MCPACTATATTIVAGITSTGGLAALVFTKLRKSNPAKSNQEKGEQNESENRVAN
jgi:hypothetical protein